MKKYFLISLILLATINLFSQEKELDDKGAALFKKVDPTVVAIQIEKSGGSGFIIAEDGYILTNGHVIADATPSNPLQVSQRITVILNDETKYSAKVIGHSLDPDVALLKIEPEKALVVSVLSDSDKVQTGQKCYALGMPVGHKRTLTSGIISNTERVLHTYTTVLQTDAAINPGNSGGPLFNENGEVIGLNTYSGGGQNLGFTIPINVALTMKDHYLKHGYFKRAIVPFFFTQNIYEELGKYLEIDGGVLIDFVEANSMAAKAGMRSGDIVTHKNGQKVTVKTIANLLRFEWEMATQEVGSTLSLTLKRKVDGAYVEIPFEAKMVEDEPAIARGAQIGEIKELYYAELGLGVRPITTTAKYTYRIENANGVMITSVDPNTDAHKAGFNQNKYSPDVIHEVNFNRVKSIDEFEKALNKALINQTEYISLSFNRGKIVIPTVIKPNYELKGKKIAFLLPNDQARFTDTLFRAFISLGAKVQFYTHTAKPLIIQPQKRGDQPFHMEQVFSFSELEAFAPDAIIAFDQENMTDNSYEAISTFLSNINIKKTVVATIGFSSYAITKHMKNLKNKKITSDPRDSNLFDSLGLEFTGKNIESDDKLVSFNGIKEDKLEEFFKKLKSQLK